MQTTFYVINLYSSIPIDKTGAVIIEMLSSDIDDLRKRTKLTLTGIHKLLCLSTNYFVFDNRVRSLENSGLISLALRVVNSEAFLHRLEDETIQEALTAKLAYNSRSKTVHQSHSFLNMFNKQSNAIRHTMEKEDQSQKLNFLEIIVINTAAGNYEFKIRRKNAITNAQIKPNHIRLLIHR